MSRAVAAGMILLYQRHVSPRKGYGCPLRLLRGRVSCAEFARRAVRRVGVVKLLPLLRRRFARCALARKAAASFSSQPIDYETPRPPPPRKARRWRRERTPYDGSRWNFCQWCDFSSDVLCCACHFGDCDGPG